MGIEHINKLTKYQNINKILYALSEGIIEILEDEVIGIYLFGSLSYDDFNPKRSDIDLLVVVKKPLSVEKTEEIKKFHFALEERFTGWKERIECSYTPHEMFKNKIPIELHRPYFGAGKFYPGATYGNEWLINNYLVYHHGIALVGRDFKSLVDPIDIKDVQKASLQDLFKEWEPKINDREWLKNSHYQSYLVLNLCRILYTVLHGKAGSKSVSATWVKKEFPEWKMLIEEAEGWEYGKEMKMTDETIEFIKFTLEKVNDKRHEQ